MIKIPHCDVYNYSDWTFYAPIWSFKLLFSFKCFKCNDKKSRKGIFVFVIFICILLMLKLLIFSKLKQVETWFCGEIKRRRRRSDTVTAHKTRFPIIHCRPVRGEGRWRRLMEWGCCCAFKTAKKQLMLYFNGWFGVFKRDTSKCQDGGFDLRLQITRPKVIHSHTAHLAAFS